VLEHDPERGKIMKELSPEPTYARRDLARALDAAVDDDQKWRVDVLAVGETHWASNALEFDTELAAALWGSDLLKRWFGAERFRVVPVSVPRGELAVPAHLDPHIKR
jgi:hypothetical protein